MPLGSGPGHQHFKKMFPEGSIVHAGLETNNFRFQDSFSAAGAWRRSRSKAQRELGFVRFPRKGEQRVERGAAVGRARPGSARLAGDGFIFARAGRPGAPQLSS